MQRSAWLGSFIGVIFLLFIAMKQFEGLSIAKIAITLTVLFIGFNLIINVSNIDTSFISYRYSKISSATNERSVQWINGIQNFKQMPIGSGSGQVGQVASRYEKGIIRSFLMETILEYCQNMELVGYYFTYSYFYQ